MSVDQHIEIPLSHSAYNKIKGKDNDDMFMTNSEPIAEVFADADLTLPSDYMASYDTKTNSLELTGTFSVGKKDDNGFGNLGWGGYDGYWLLVKKDKNGKDLKKPKLTYFTVRDSYAAEDLKRPETVSFGVSDNGALQIHWSSVEGAKKYRLYVISKDDNSQYGKSLTEELADVSTNNVSLDKIPGY